MYTPFDSSNLLEIIKSFDKSFLVRFSKFWAKRVVGPVGGGEEMTKSGAPFSARDRRRMVRFLLAGCKDSRARGELVAETPPRELQPKLADSNSANDIEGKGDKNSFCLENGIYIVRVLKENVNPLRFPLD